MSPRQGNAVQPARSASQAVAFAVHASRNVMVQTAGVGMVILAALNVTPWPWVAGWTVLALTVLSVEHQFLQRAAKAGEFSRRTAAWAAVLRISATSLYSLAALTLIARGGPSERLFAFALICCSMVNVLMRYYRQRWILIGALAPYVAILTMVAFIQVRLAVAQGNVLAT